MEEEEMFISEEETNLKRIQEYIQDELLPLVFGQWLNKSEEEV